MFLLCHADLAKYLGHVFKDEFGDKHARLPQHSPILKITFYQFTTNFLRQSHFDGMCELTNEELIDLPHVLLVSYAEYLVNGVLFLIYLL